MRVSFLERRLSRIPHFAAFGSFKSSSKWSPWFSWFRLINQKNLPPLGGGGLADNEMDANWMVAVTPFDSLLAIRQKRGGEAPSEDPPKTRENRITAVGNDLYSADSRSFLNPFLRISRCTRLFPLHPWQHPYPSNCLPHLLSPSATDPVSLSLSLHLPGNLRRSFALSRYTFPRNGNCSVSQIMPTLFSHRESSPALRTLSRVFCTPHVQPCPETSISDTLT